MDGEISQFFLLNSVESQKDSDLNRAKTKHMTYTEMLRNISSIFIISNDFISHPVLEWCTDVLIKDNILKALQKLREKILCYFLPLACCKSDALAQFTYCMQTASRATCGYLYRDP